MYLFVARREMVNIVLLDGGRYQFSRSRKIERERVCERERERVRERVREFSWVR